MRSSTRRTILWALALVLGLVLVGVAYVRGGEDGGSADTAPDANRSAANPATGAARPPTADARSTGRWPAANRTPRRPSRWPRSPRAGGHDRADRDRGAPAGGRRARRAVGREPRRRDRRHAQTDAPAPRRWHGARSTSWSKASTVRSSARSTTGSAPASCSAGRWRAAATSTPRRRAFWLRRGLIDEDGDWDDVEGGTKSSSRGGLAAAAVQPIDTLLAQHSLGVTNVDIVPASSSQAVDTPSRTQPQSAARGWPKRRHRGGGR